MKPTVFAGYCLILTRVTATVAPVTAGNQGANPSKWWNSDHYKRELGLTVEQSRKLEDIFQQSAPTLQTLKKALDEAEAQFERIADQADERAAIEQIDRVVDARANLMRAHSRMLWKMRRILTREQWTRLGALNQALEKEREKSSEKASK